MKSGYLLIKELGKQGLRGYFFSYSQYNKLAKIKDFSEVKEKIAEWGYPAVLKANDFADIVNLLKNSKAMTQSEKGCLTAIVLEPLFWLLLIFSSC